MMMVAFIRQMLSRPTHNIEVSGDWISVRQSSSNTCHRRAFLLQSRAKSYTDSAEKVWTGCDKMGEGLEGPKSHETPPALPASPPPPAPCPTVTSGSFRANFPTAPAVTIAHVCSSGSSKTLDEDSTSHAMSRRNAAAMMRRR